MGKVSAEARRGGRAALIALVLALTCAALIGAGSVAAAPGPPDPAFATTGDRSELVNTIPISRHGERRVVMSLSPGRLPDPRDGDRFTATAEVQVTVDCLIRVRRCVGPPYYYSPLVSARLILADGAQVTGGDDAIPLAPSRRQRCLGTLPNREHHCVIVFRDAALNVERTGDLPCAPERCRINLVLEASSPKARPGDLLILGGSRPDGTIAQDRGRINAIRFGPGRHPRHTVRTHRIRLARHPLDEVRRTVYSQRVRGLERGDILTAEARMTTDVARLPYNARITSQLLLTERRGQVHASSRVRRIAGPGELSESNGFNCTRPRTPCTTRRVGGLVIKRDPVDARGRPLHLFVNLTLLTTPKLTGLRPQDRLPVVHPGGLSVTTYQGR